jgi:hypothetical protein
MTQTNPDLKDFPGLHGFDADPSEDAHMDKGIARPVRYFDESKPLRTVEPFDG